MHRNMNVGRFASILMVGALALATVHDAAAQMTPSQQVTAQGYIPPGTRYGKGLAPGLQVTDLGKSGRTYRVNLKKGDEIMSGLTEFAEKYRIKNAYFTGLGAVNKGLFGWADPESGLGQRKIELNQEAEIVSFIGNISVDNQGRTIVHGHGSVAFSDGTIKGGHWWEAYVSIIAVIFVTEQEIATEPSK
jgi:predicted DNA-binding protein with PD1-like motif